VSAGGFHTLALTEDGEVYAWGNGVHGECGIGDSIEVNVPRLVKI
jgi:alpha-tubulin suppressor-like RCC1 family protein